MFLIEELPYSIIKEIYWYTSSECRLNLLISNKNIYHQLIPFIYKTFKHTISNQLNIKKYGRYIQNLNLVNKCKSITNERVYYDLLQYLQKECNITLGHLQGYSTEQLDILSQFKIVKLNYKCFKGHKDLECKDVDKVLKLGLFKNLEILTIDTYQCYEILETKDIFMTNLKELNFSASGSLVFDFFNKALINFNQLTKLNLTLYNNHFNLNNLLNREYLSLTQLEVLLRNYDHCDSYSCLKLDSKNLPQLKKLHLNLNNQSLLLLNSFKNLIYLRLKSKMEPMKYTLDNLPSILNLDKLSLELDYIEGGRMLVRENKLNTVDLSLINLEKLTCLTLTNIKINIAIIMFLKKYDQLINLNLNACCFDDSLGNLIDYKDYQLSIRCLCLYDSFFINHFLQWILRHSLNLQAIYSDDSNVGELINGFSNVKFHLRGFYQ